MVLGGAGACIGTSVYAYQQATAIAERQRQFQIKLSEKSWEGDEALLSNTRDDIACCLWDKYGKLIIPRCPRYMHADCSVSCTLCSLTALCGHLDTNNDGKLDAEEIKK